MAGLVVTTGFCEIVLGAQCQSIYAFWDRSAGTCWDPTIYNNVIWAQVGKNSGSFVSPVLRKAHP